MRYLLALAFACSLPLTACKDRGLESQALADDTAGGATTPWSMACKSGSASALKITLVGTTVQNLTLGDFDYVVNGVLQAEHDSIFGITVGAVQGNENGMMTIDVSYNDYSEEHGAQIFFSKQAKEAAVITTFKTSDGDDLLHVRAISMKCQ